MPFFSFVLEKPLKNEVLLNLDVNTRDIISKSRIKTKYYSKNTKLWNLLNKNKLKKNIFEIKFEKIIKIKNFKKKILFCLPPSLGLGDVVEYGLAIHAVKNSKQFSKVGIAFTGRYNNILKKYFFLKYTYPEIINENVFRTYDTIFHVSYEIPEFKNQKYIRSDIENNLTNYFNVNKFRKSVINEIKVSKITIFPISASPLRTMPLTLLLSIINYFKNDYLIDVVLDNSEISNYLENKIEYSAINKKKPHNLDSLLTIIESLEFGIFMDSGPLHVAKILNKPGVLIESSVNENVLLNNFKTIQTLKNYYKSNYCAAPCGLTNIINLNDKIGCFDSMKQKKIDFNKLDNLNSLQRGRLAKQYKNFIENPVSCLRSINKINLNNFIEKVIKKS